MRGLSQYGIDVIQCYCNRYLGLRKYFDIIRQFLNIRRNVDVFIVGFPGYQVVILLRFLTSKPIIFDAFTSLYLSTVIDRKKTRPFTIKAVYYWLLDYFSCKLSNVVLLDTEAQISYFLNSFNLRREKFLKVFVGAEEPSYYLQEVNRTKKDGPFLVHFHGSCVPLQGIEYILEAAKILESEDIKFKIIGSKIKKNFKDESLLNVDFLDDAPYGKLPQQMAMADICLGIFGNTNKARRVIPNKVFEALAVGRAILTGNSPAIRELLVDRENAFFCRLADSQDLADKIMELKNNSELRENIAQKGRELFNQELTSRKIIENLLKEFKI